MKISRLLIFALLHLSSLSIMAQSGYWYGTKFIKLTPKESPYRFLQTTDDISRIIEKQMIDEAAKGKMFAVKISDNRYILNVDDLKTIDTNKIYTSNVYTNTNGAPLLILPNILLSMKNGYEPESVLKRYDRIFSVVRSSKGRLKLQSKLTTSKSVLEYVELISKEKGVEWCEPEFLTEVSTESFTDNPYYWDQYYIKNFGQNGGTYGMDVNAISENGSPDITVAVIDMGVDQNHEDLSNCVLSGYTIGNPTGHGLPQNPNSYDRKAHGMACAGIIGAADNTLGIMGVAHGVKILPVNIFPNYASTDVFGNFYQGSGTNDEIAEAIRWAYPTADVLSCSWTIGTESNAIRSAIEDARAEGRNGLGSVVVFSSGNNNSYYFGVSFPAYVDGVLAVGGIYRNGTICDYSQRGDSLDLVALGGNGDIVTTDRMGNLGYTSGNYTTTFSGTSAACPQVAGVAALVLSVAPYLTESQVRAVLQNTARDLGTVGYDTVYGHGLVNANEAVRISRIEFSGPSAIPPSGRWYHVLHLPENGNAVWSLEGDIANDLDLEVQSSNGSICWLSRRNSNISSGIIKASVYIGGNFYKTYSAEISTTNSTSLSASVNIESRGTEYEISLLNVDENVAVSLRNGEDYITNVEVSNITSGEKVIESHKITDKFSFSTSGWTPGLYLISVLTKDGIKTRKISVK